MYFTTSLDAPQPSPFRYFSLVSILTGIQPWTLQVTDMPYKLCRITGTRTNWDVFTGIHNQLERHSIGLLAQLRPECFEYRNLDFFESRKEIHKSIFVLCFSARS